MARIRPGACDASLYRPGWYGGSPTSWRMNVYIEHTRYAPESHDESDNMTSSDASLTRSSAGLSCSSNGLKKNVFATLHTQTSRGLELPPPTVTLDASTYSCPCAKIREVEQVYAPLGRCAVESEATQRARVVRSSIATTLQSIPECQVVQRKIHDRSPPALHARCA